MADHDDRQARARLLRQTVIAALYFVQDVLRGLPIPVEIPDPFEGDELNPEAILALNRARSVIADEPIRDRAKKAYGDLILNWLMAYELMVIASIGGPAPWRLDACEYSLNGLAVLAEMIETDDLGEDDEQD
ncbi:hypothetical protein [Streptomyces sp. NPDC102487]|uniref:hypothetical protein n=1 Tax=Streptomyces sp. NPDC102487 TaxID=3366182 RepID=UPI003802C9E4